MVGGGVERVEAMPLGLDVGAVGEGEAHAAEDLDGAVLELGDGMQRAGPRGGPGRVTSMPAKAAASASARRAAFASSSAAVTAVRTSLRSLPMRGLSSLETSFMPLLSGGEGAGLAEEADAGLLDGGFIGGGGDGSEGVGAELFELGVHENCGG